MKIDKNLKSYGNEYDKYSDMAETIISDDIIKDDPNKTMPPIMPEIDRDILPVMPNSPGMQNPKFFQQYAMGKKPKVEPEKKPEEKKTNEQIKRERLEELRKELKIK